MTMEKRTKFFILLLATVLLIVLLAMAMYVWNNLFSEIVQNGIELVKNHIHGNKPYMSIGITPRARKDKTDIAISFIKHLEYNRQHYYDSNVDWFYDYYIERSDTVTDKYIPSPFPAQNEVSASVERIEYNKDSCLCFAIIVIEIHLTPLEGYTGYYSKNLFHGHAVIGLRNSINQKFRLYPEQKYCYSTTSLKSAVVNVDRYYSKYLKGDWSNKYPDKFRQNVIDSDFFEKSIFFKKFDDTTYYFQTYLGKDGKHHKYNYRPFEFYLEI